MSQPRSSAFYWDASAIVSTLMTDRFSDEASRVARASASHMMSSLAWAEVQAVIARAERERTVAARRITAMRRLLETGPWMRVSVDPEAHRVVALARTWPLRGADLWHLAAAKTLQSDVPELRLLSFDARLVAAAVGESLA